VQDVIFVNNVPFQYQKTLDIVLPLIGHEFVTIRHFTGIA